MSAGALAWLGVDAFEKPLWLLLGFALAAGAWAWSWRRPPSALGWPAWREARAAGAQRRDAPATLARATRAAVLVLLAAVLAGPVALRGAAPETSGLDLLLVVDTSGSMRALDANVAGKWHTRLSLARRVVRRFAMQRVAEGDRVGLVVFGDNTFTQCPLTHDGELLAAALERVEAGMAGEATALGDALALAVKRVSASAGSQPAVGPGEGRLVVLLTDGRSNAGNVPPDVAAALAAGRGVRVHTVGIGSEGEVPMAREEGGERRGLRFERHDLDSDTLSQVAAATGGAFFRTTSSRDLEAVYAAIDALERTPRPGRRSSRPRPRPEPLLALAAGLLIVELVALRAAVRRVP